MPAKTKKKEHIKIEVTDLGGEEVSSTKASGRGKRKASGSQLIEENGGKEKIQKKDTEAPPNKECIFTPRRSSRGVVPNRKFKDMEVEYTPGKKQATDSKKDVKKEVKKEHSNTKTKAQLTPKRSPKVSSKQSKELENKDQDSSSETANEMVTESVAMVPNPEETIPTETINCNSTPTIDPVSEGVTIVPVCKEEKDLPTMKIVNCFNETSKLNTDISQDTKPSNESSLVIQTLPTESEPTDYSIIREEDLERITSELLELAQNAEQEQSLQQLLGPQQVNNPELVSSSYTVANMKLVEVATDPEESSKENNNACGENPTIYDNDCSLQSNSYPKEVFGTPSFDTAGMDVKAETTEDGNRNRINDTSQFFVGKNRPASIIVIENVMKKQTTEEGSDKNSVDDDNCNKEAKKSELSDLGNGMHEMETEIQQAVKNALLVLTEKTAELSDIETGEENDKIGSTETEEGYSSSGTQTAKEVIKLPALNPKSRLVKTVKVVVKKPGENAEDDGKADPRVKQEFVIVHVPDGQMIKRHHVKSSKPEETIPFTMDERGMYQCGVCKYETYKKANLYKHRKKHVDDKPHCCPYCDYKTATSSNLKRHISIHQDVRSFQCELCNASFRQKIHLERHIRYRHEEKKVKCPLCDYVCANENPDLKVHMKRRHLPLDAEDGSYQAFKCDECGLVTLNKKDFKQHMKFHRSGPELKLFCDFCSFVTDCESRLKRHSFIHSKERPYQCGACDYRGSQREHVVRHMRSQHGIELPKRKKGVDDDIANSTEDSNDSREDQIGLRLKGDSSKPEKHDYSSQEKIFACNHCSMKFSKLINLYKHLHAQHKDILPDQSDNEFLCVVCDFKTTTKKNLLVHMRKHNQIDQIPPSHVYSCVLCNYINPKRRNLFQHMKKKHGIEIVMKDDGSTSCFVADANSVASSSDQNLQNILTVGDMVTTETDEQELQIVTEEFEKDGIHVQNVISFDDIAYAASHPQPHNRKMIVIDQSSLIQEHEAAEAIEGLQALAEQPGIVSSQEIIEDPELITADDNTEVNIDNVSKIVSASETMPTSEKENNGGSQKVTGEEGIQISADEVMNLSAGDFVEINGEMYKVEISDIPSATSEIVATTS